MNIKFHIVDPNKIFTKEKSQISLSTLININHKGHVKK